MPLGRERLRRILRSLALGLGLAGAFLALAFGLVGYALTRLGGSKGEALGYLSLPVLAFLGVGLVRTRPVLGAAFLAMAGGLLLLLVGLHGFSLLAAWLLWLGGLLGLCGTKA